MNPSFKPDIINKEERWINDLDREKIRNFVVPLIKDKSTTWPQTIQELNIFIRENKIAVNTYSPNMFKWLFGIAHANQRFSELWDPLLGDNLRAVWQLNGGRGRNEENIIKKWEEGSNKEEEKGFNLIIAKANELLEARKSKKDHREKNNFQIDQKISKLVLEFSTLVRNYPFSGLLYLYNNGDLKYLWGLTNDMTIGNFKSNQEFTFSQTVGDNWDSWNV